MDSEVRHDVNPQCKLRTYPLFGLFPLQAAPRPLYRSANALVHKPKGNPAQGRYDSS